MVDTEKTPESTESGKISDVLNDPTVKTLRRRRGGIKASITKLEKQLNESKCLDSKYIASLELVKENMKTIHKFDSEI